MVYRIVCEVFRNIIETQQIKGMVPTGMAVCVVPVWNARDVFVSSITVKFVKQTPSRVLEW